MFSYDIAAALHMHRQKKKDTNTLTDKVISQLQKKKKKKTNNNNNQSISSRQDADSRHIYLAVVLEVGAANLTIWFLASTTMQKTPKPNSRNMKTFFLSASIFILGFAVEGPKACILFLLGLRKLGFNQPKNLLFLRLLGLILEARYLDSCVADGHELLS